MNLSESARQVEWERFAALIQVPEDKEPEEEYVPPADMTARAIIACLLIWGAIIAGAIIL